MTEGQTCFKVLSVQRRKNAPGKAMGAGMSFRVIHKEVMHDPQEMNYSFEIMKMSPFGGKRKKKSWR